VKRSDYTMTGVSYLVLSLPAWAALAQGRLFASRNPYLLFSILGAPMAAVFLALAAGRLPRTGKADTALRVSVFGIGFALCGWGAWVGVHLGVEPLMTAVQFAAAASTYLALVSLALIVAGLVTARRTS